MSGSAAMGIAESAVSFIPGIGPLIAAALKIADAAGAGAWLGQHILGDTGGAVAQAVVDAAKVVTGGAVDSATIVGLDPDKRAALQVQLAQIAQQREAVQLADQQAQRVADLDRIKAALGDTASARSQTVALAQAGSRIAWAPVAVTCLVLATFAVLAVVVMTRELPPGSAQAINIMLGALVGMATSSVAYWVGSTASSAQRTEALANSVPASVVTAMQGRAPSSPLAR